jgi:hypothetical protein
MKKLALLTTFLLVSAMTQAVACEWEKVHASGQNATVVACAGGACVAQPQTTQQEPVAPQIADEPTEPAPTTIADGSTD